MTDKEKAMFTDAFSSMSTNDMQKARVFYLETLGLRSANAQEGLTLSLPGGGKVFIYPKDDHEPATFTVLNFQVDDIDAAVDDLKGRGITFESYAGEIQTDEKGVFRGAERGHGPNIAWFKDPAGNILSIIERQA